MNTKVVRRFPSRFRDGAPEYVVDIFDHPNFGDRYTVVCAMDDGTLVMLTSSANPSHPMGVFSGWNVIEPWNLRVMRDTNRRKRISWTELPERLRDIIVSDMTEDIT